MDRWEGKVALVTGASSGIGVAIAKDLVKHGMIVVGVARRKELIDDIAEEINGSYSGKLYSLKCDVSKEEEILQVFTWIKTNLGGVDVLVNNAGIVIGGMLMAPDNSDMLKTTVNLNILGLCYCTREAIQSMNERNVAGHIFNMNSIIGHKQWYVPGLQPCCNIYGATKHAVGAMTETLRMELMHADSKIKVTSISPGIVKTEIFNHMLNSEELGEQYLNTTAHLETEDISNALLYCLGTPPHVQIHEMIIKPVGEKY